MQKNILIREGKPGKVCFMHCVTAAQQSEWALMGLALLLLWILFERLLQKQPPETGG